MRVLRSVLHVPVLWAILGCSGSVGPDAAGSDTMGAPSSRVPSDGASNLPAGPDGTSASPTPNASVPLPATPEPNPGNPAPDTSASPSSPEQPSTILPGRGAVTERCAERGDTIGVSRLRRITREAYANSVSDLLGVALSTARSIEPDESIGPFYSNAIAPVTDLIVEQYQSTAGEAARAALARRDELAGCDLGAQACRGAFIASFGKRAYRRPLKIGRAHV